MSEIITPTILAERIQKKTGLDSQITKKFSFAFFKIIKEQLKNHSSFIIHKFGTFKKIRVEQSVGRNPRTNEQIIIPAHWKIRFTPCRSLAQRLNAKYAHLKAIAIPLPFFKNEKLAMPPISDNAISDTPISENDNSVSDTNSDKKRTAILIGMGALLLAACLFLLIKLLGCANSSKEQVSENPVSVPEPATASEPTAAAESTTTSELAEENVSEPATIAEPATASDPAEENVVQPESVQPAKTESTQVAEQPEQEEQKITPHRREFKVPAGSCYYKIAEKEFNNRHTWPVIYAENSAQNPDPDLIDAYSSIFIPDSSLMSSNSEKYKESYIKTYNAYYSIIKAQPDNKKNPIRKFRAVRVLVSGEILYPGFIEEYKSSVEYQDYLDALAIFSNYVP